MQDCVLHPHAFLIRRASDQLFSWRLLCQSASAACCPAPATCTYQRVPNWVLFCSLSSPGPWTWSKLASPPPEHTPSFPPSPKRSAVPSILCNNISHLVKLLRHSPQLSFLPSCLVTYTSYTHHTFPFPFLLSTSSSLPLRIFGLVPLSYSIQFSSHHPHIPACRPSPRPIYTDYLPDGHFLILICL